MAIALQGLIDRINTEGVQQADAKKAEIIAQAQKEAADILAKAKEEAAAMKKDAQTFADGLQSRAESAIRQSMRDILIELKSRIEQRVTLLVKEGADQALTPDFMATVIADMVKRNPQNGGADVIVSQTQGDALVKALCASLKNSFKLQPDIQLGAGFAGGFKIGFKGEDVFFDFSDEALTELICAYVGPRIARIIEAKA